MAQSGRSVRADRIADIRRPRIAKLYNIESENGMATASLAPCELMTQFIRARFRCCRSCLGGTRPSNPAELLSQPTLRNLLGALREKFDV